MSTKDSAKLSTFSTLSIGIGPLVGLGKERIRQLTHRALARLREQVPEGPWSIGA